MMRCSLRLASCFVALSFAPLAIASAEPQLFYSKYFKGSVPEYTQISVDRSGKASYQEAKDDENPIRIQLSEAEVSAMFDAAAKLNHFQNPVESGLKVANMGQKTFRYEDDKEKHEVLFNYSIDPNAQAMLDWFERIAETEQDFIALDRAVHYDKLGVNDALLLLAISQEHKRLVAAPQFLPLLDRIAKNETFLHIARERAASIADEIRKPAAPEKQAQP